MKLTERPLDELHQLCCAEVGDTGLVYGLANAIYRLHVLALIVLVRVGRLSGGDRA